MRARYLGWVLCAALSLGASAAADAATYAKKERLPPAGACADWRWIAITDSPSTPCPVAPRGWTERPLFASAGRDPYGKERYEQLAPREGMKTTDVVGELNRFCVYEASRDAKRSPPPPFPQPRKAGLARVERDCAAISRAAGVNDMTSADLAQISTHFLAHAGKAAAMRIRNQAGVRLAVVDTEPTDDSGMLAALPAAAASPPPYTPPPYTPRHPQHGYTLAHIARELVCSPEEPDACAALVTTRQAMSLMSFDAAHRVLTDDKSDRPGGFGTQGDLAGAIVDEVAAWRASRDARGEPRHLVLNLSLGWDPSLFGGLDEAAIEDMRAGTQAVYRALQYAKSADALVVAAAGNRRDCCPQSTGPLLPAAWERSSPKDSALGGARQPTPLVYAVGGVRSDGRALANARELGMPERAAYGENGVIAKGKDGKITSTWLYTGSSVATAVVASAAALVWDSFPNLTPERVMQILDESGEPLAFEADFWFGGGIAPDAHKISVCQALRHACDVQHAADASSVCPLGDDRCPEVKEVRAAFPAWATQPTSTACHPWVVPQPDDPPCLPCGPRN